MIDSKETGWIQTFTGKKFYPMQPDPEDVCIEDIAHALSNLCRFNGHCKIGFYSVAQHSVLVSNHVPFCDAAWGLLHDAAEAYLIDLPRPVKQWLRKSGITVFDTIEKQIMEAIRERFALSAKEPDSIKRLDQMLLATESRDIMSPLHPDWRIRKENGYECLNEQIIPWHPVSAENAFLEAAVAVGIRR